MYVIFKDEHNLDIALDPHAIFKIETLGEFCNVSYLPRGGREANVAYVKLSHTVKEVVEALNKVIGIF